MSRRLRTYVVSLVALGVMFKAQILLVSPILVLWPLWRGQFSAIARCIIGFMSGHRRHDQSELREPLAHPEHHFAAERIAR